MATFNGLSNGIPVVFYVHRGWYVQHGGTCVNHSLANFYEGMDIEEIHDDNAFTWSEINSEEELINAVDS